MKISVVCCGNNESVRFAACELQRYLRLGTRQAISLARFTGPRPGTVITIGLACDLGIRPPSSLGPEDDWISIQARNGRVVISGVNGRSVLFAAYRYLHELGFRWVRPGRRGEVIPRLKTTWLGTQTIREKPAYRFRTICIEGAASEQHVLDLVDWMAKHGMNGYFLQLEHGTWFWKWWYKHAKNPYRRPEKCDQERIDAIVRRIIAAIQKRGLRFERMGHGWTQAALGVTDESSGNVNPRVSPKKRHWLPLINGKRAFFKTPHTTNLCYSNPKVRSTFAGEVVDYARKHPETTALHVWLADGSNNNCECTACRKGRTADFYVQILNEVDAQLKAAGLDTRVIFLIYVDLMWPPARQKILNPNRFVLMFAPITRAYDQSFADAGEAGEGRMQKYVLNKLKFPKGAAENLAYLRAWQKSFKGDGFDFDYHLLWAAYYDFSLFNLTRVLHEDIRSLKGIGLNGYNSCQVQRLSFPHNLSFEVMARTLWNRTPSFDRLVADHFSVAYGKDWRKAASFFDRISRLWSPFSEAVYIPRPDDQRIELGRRNIPKIRAMAADMQPIMMRNLRATRGPIQWSWRYMQGYLRLLEKLLPFFEAYLTASPKIRSLYKQLVNQLYLLENTLHPGLDARTAAMVLRWRVHECLVDNPGARKVKK